MVDEDLKRLLSAEKTAQQKVEKAKDVAVSIIDKAEKESLSERKRRIQEFEASRVTKLEEATERGKIESDRIRKEGIQIAEGIRKKAKITIPNAVDEVLDLIKEN